MLDALGLNDDESLVYAELVRRGTARYEELDVLPGVTRTRARAAVQGLAALGLATVAENDPPRVIAAPPDIAGELLVLRRMQELCTARAEIGRLADEYRSSSREEAPSLPVEFTPDVAVRQRLDQIQRRARQEVLILDKPPYLVGHNAPEIEVLAGGVRYRTLYDRQAVESPGGLERVQRFLAAGEQARTLPALPLKMVIVDRSLAILPTLDGGLGGPGGTALVHPSPLLDGLVELFERLWAQGLALLPTGIDRKPSGALDPADSWLLVLLLSGLTDEVIARRLGVGRRTVLRRVRVLMDRAGATTRMQLGWHAARHGWMPDGEDAPRPFPEQIPSRGSDA
ncbi:MULTISPECIES: TrmB family transcriptional regulator [Streptomyces]|uniref:TrmB family transcriptional regulator n=1 Tax=Streptomyces TaxID=1883 RepID=UPI00278C18A3|nr:helix-turn-helix domain-containing protein [Streptomyces hydrogenans]